MRESHHGAMVRFSEPSGEAIYFTRAWLDFAGRAQQEERGFGWTERIHPEDRERVLARIGQAALDGGPLEFEYRLQRYDGEYIAVLEEVEPQESPEGTSGGCLSTIRPVSEEAEEKAAAEGARNGHLPELDTRYRAIIDSIDQGFCIVEVLLDGDGRPVDYRFVEMNPVFESQTGLQDPLGKTARELVPELDEFWFETYGRVALTGEPMRFESHAPAMGRWFDVYTFRVGEPERRQVGILFNDITARKQAEDEAWYRGRQLETLLNAAPLGVYLVDADFRIAQVNPIALPVFGDIQDLIGRDFEEVVQTIWSKEYADQVVGIFQQTLATGEPHHTPELTEYREDRGVVEYYEWRTNRITLPDGRYGVVCYFRDISEQVRARQRIAESEERYRTLFESMDQGFCIMQMIFDEEMRPVDGQLLEVNPVFERETGIKNPLSRTVRQSVPELEPLWFEVYGEVARTGQATRFMEHSTALQRWFEVYAFPVGRTDERKVAILFNNVTARQQAEAALRESEARFRAMADGLPLMVWVHDEEGQQEFVNRAFCEFFDITIEESGGDGWQMLMHPDDAEAYAEEFLACTREQGPFNAEVRVRDRRGRWRWLESWGQPRFAPSGEFRGFVGASADVTHQKEIEESLRTQRRELEAALELNRMITDNAHSCLLMTDGEGCVTYMNPAAERVTGFAIAELRDEQLHDKIHYRRPDGSPYPVDECPLHEAYRAMDDINYFEETFIRKDGAFFPVAGSVISIMRYGVHEGSLIEFRDLSEMRETEEALQQSESRFRVVTDAIPQLVWISEGSGKVTYFNDGWYDYTGQTGEEALGWGWRNAVHPDDRERIAEAWRNAVEHQERYEVEYRIRRGDGQYRWHIGRSLPLVDREGQVHTWFGTCTDIDGMKQTEEELRRANAIKDEFLSLVSHELRTPLTTIVGLTRVLSKNAEGLSDENRESVEIMARDSERLQTLIENLLVLARVDQKDVELEPLLLARLIERVVATHREQHPEREVEVEIAKDLPIVEGQGVWVEQVLTNGLSNAEKYSPKDQPISVRAFTENDEVVVQVIDRGPGVDEEELERLFEPFFRSSRALKLAIPGAGLGMSISRRLMELQGGTIRARHGDTGGLLFEFTLPVLVDG